MNKDQAYHQIALACLKTLRSGQNAASEDTVKALYETIDTAFEAQYFLLVSELSEAKRRLSDIAALGEHCTLKDAQLIATSEPAAH